LLYSFGHLSHGLLEVGDAVEAGLLLPPEGGGVLAMVLAELFSGGLGSAEGGGDFVHGFECAAQLRVIGCHWLAASSVSASSRVDVTRERTTSARDVPRRFTSASRRRRVSVLTRAAISGEGIPA